MAFTRISKLVIEDGQTSPCEVPELGPDAVLHLAHTGQINKPYFNARFGESLAAAQKAARKGMKGRKQVEEIAAKQIDDDLTREQDRELFPLHVIKGWDSVLDDSDTPAEFSVENAQEVVNALCAHESLWPIFDRIRHHAANAGNYRELPEDLEDLAKN